MKIGFRSQESGVFYSGFYLLDSNNFHPSLCPCRAWGLVGGESQLDGLPQTHLVGQEIPGAAVLMGVEGQLDEGFRVGPSP